MNKENEVLAIPFEVAEQEEAPKGKYQLEKITPQIAAEYMKCNTQNRDLNDGLAKYYASEMKKGNWRTAMASPITFDWNGVLQNGQHRLQAIILSGCTIEMWVARNANPNDFTIIDTGKTRGLKDTFALSGINNPTDTAAVIKRYFLLCNKNTAVRGVANTSPAGNAHCNGPRKATLTNQVGLNLHDECPEFWQEAKDFGVSFYNRSKGLFTKSFTGGLYAYLYRVKGNSLDTIKGFFDELAGGSINNTIILLKNKLFEDARKAPDRRMHDPDKQKYIAKAWNAYRKGKTLKLLRVNPNEEVFFD